ncbi:MAG: c-type cytochrome [Steroidobacterales bacterium]
MTSLAERGSASRTGLWTLVAIIGAVLVLFAYQALGPGPMHFAAGHHVALSDYHDGDPTGVPAALKSATLLERGAYLTRAADCEACHTARGGVPFAGGRAFALPFGTLYSTNITPDPETGIGRYSERNFLDAIHKGLGPENTRLYPAMPYASYTYMSDADALAIKAYLFSLRPVHAPAPANTLAFPFNQRALMGVWALLFNRDQRFEPDMDRSAEWNRGAYLVEAMGHCGECHTPRNLFLALNNREKFAGAVQEGWHGYNITSDQRSGVGTWSDGDLAHYLSIGHADGRGTASGTMGEAVDQSLKYLMPDDIAAMVAYLRTVPAVPTAGFPERKAAPADPASEFAVNGDSRGKLIYAGDCAGCHGWTGVTPFLPTATLTGTRAVNDPAATNVAQVILAGGMRHYADDASNMPAFGSAYSNAEIASVANFVTAQFGAEGSRLTAENVARMRTAQAE